MVNAVEVSDVRVVFDHDFVALNGISLDIPEGKITGFIGPSGAGKTTLIRSIVGRQKLAGGSITIFNHPADAPELRFVRSYMTQEVSVYEDLTVHENLRYFATIFGVPRGQLKQAVGDILKTVDLTPQTHQLAASLSGGQKQRLSLALSLIGDPKLLVLDEPTVGLDPVLRDQLWKLFRQLAANGRTLIISSHVMDEADRCDELVLIRDGQVLAKGTPDELRRRTNSPTVEASFIKLVESKQGAKS